MTDSPLFTAVELWPFDRLLASSELAVFELSPETVCFFAPPCACWKRAKPPPADILFTCDRCEAYLDLSLSASGNEVPWEDLEELLERVLRPLYSPLELVVAIVAVTDELLELREAYLPVAL